MHADRGGTIEQTHTAPEGDLGITAREERLPDAYLARKVSDWGEGKKNAA